MVLNKNVMFLELLVPPSLLRIVLSFSYFIQEFISCEENARSSTDANCYFSWREIKQWQQRLQETLQNLKEIYEGLRWKWNLCSYMGYVLQSSRQVYLL